MKWITGWVILFFNYVEYTDGVY